MIERLLHDATRRQRRSTAIAIGLAMVAALAGVGLLALSGWFLTGAAMAGAGGLASMRAFNYLLPSAGIRGLAIARTLSRYGERLFSHRAALFALADLRPALFARLVATDPSASLDRSSGDMAARLSSDVDALEDSVVRKVTVPGALAGAVAGLIGASFAGWSAALALLAGLAAMRLSSRILAPRLLRQPRQDHATALNQLKADYASYAACSGEIAVYGLGAQVMTALEPHARALDAGRAGIVRGEVLIHGAQLVLAGLTVIGILAVADGGAPLVALAALAAAATADSWAALARSDMERWRACDAIERLETLAMLPARQPDGAFASEAGGITFIIDGRHHVLQPGERVLIAGPSGSGKSRLLGTLIGLRRDAPQGLVVGEQDVDALGLEGLRPLFAYAPQDAALIAGTIADNLSLARPGITEAEMWEALETVCLAETVRNLPQGLAEWLGDNGARLSGGQRKRLVLARALLARKPWLVLDEPSEGLDPETERALCQLLAVWLNETGTGLVLVSHRSGLHALARQVVTLVPVSA
jgi:ATP-binding cassette subfamily C protein CydC